jgi:uncharacterized oxidoreductase
MPRIDPEHLRVFVEELLSTLGTTTYNSEAVAASLVRADLRGHGSHGVRQIPSKYAAEIDEGQINPDADPAVTYEDQTSATVDGQWADGHVVAGKAVDTAVRKAGESGIGLVGLRQTSHIGRVGEWAERATEAGMAFVGFVCNPGSQWVAPPGSARPRVSTNPIAIGLPTFEALEFPLVVDMATSQVAFGKVKKRLAADNSLPDEWVVSADDGDVNLADFRSTDTAAIRPLGGRTAGYKGFGLAVMTELLAANITDGTVSGMDDVVSGNLAVFLVIDLERFTTRERIVERAASMAAHVRGTDASLEAPGAMGDETLLPGEAEHITTQRRLDSGIPFSPADVDALIELARETGVDEAIVTDTFP